jgi:glycosyl transferase family 25
MKVVPSPNIQIVSLEQSRARRAQITKKLVTAGVDFQFLDATDARTLAPTTIAELVDLGRIRQIQGRQLSKGEIACADSHRRLYRKLIAQELEGMLILEDDVELASDFRAVVTWVEQNALQLADSRSILYLGGREGFEDRRIAFARKSRAGPTSSQTWNRVIRSEHAVQRTCGYYITRGSAASILYHEPKIAMTADAWEHRLRQRIIEELWVLQPPCIYHPRDLDTSLIEIERNTFLKSKNRLIDRHPILVPLSRSWRFLKKVVRRAILYPVLRRIG